jgi:putative phosphoribosyl transferase
VGRVDKMFLNRKDAAEKLSLKINPNEFVSSHVLSLSTEGLIIAKELAHQIKSEYELLISEVLIDPGKYHLEFGAIVEDQIPFVVEEFNLSNPLILEIIHEAQRKILNKRNDYRRGRELSSLQGKTIFLVDDWLVWGVRLMAALHFLQSNGVKETILCSPILDHHLTNFLPNYRAYYLEKSEEGNSIRDFYKNFNPLKRSEALAIFQI